MGILPYLLSPSATAQHSLSCAVHKRMFLFPVGIFSVMLWVRGFSHQCAPPPLLGRAVPSAPGDVAVHEIMHTQPGVKSSV